MAETTMPNCGTIQTTYAGGGMWLVQAVTGGTPRTTLTLGRVQQVGPNPGKYQAVAGTCGDATYTSIDEAADAVVLMAIRAGRGVTGGPR